MFGTDACDLRSGARSLRWFACLLFIGAVACGDDDGDSGEPDADVGEDGGGDPPDPRDSGEDPEPRDAGRDSGGGEPEPDASEPDPDAGVDAGPLTLGGLTVTVDPEDHDLDLFGAAGHRFWFEVSEEQIRALNNAGQGGGWWPEGDIYTPGVDSKPPATYADHVLVENAETGEVADYGQIEIDLIGGITFRQWNQSTIPNVRIDANEFDKDMRIGTFEHMRLNNSIVGTIFREAMAHRIYRALDYPALRSSFAYFGGSVWGEDVWVPMTLIESYKRRFCRDNEELLGGSCDNMWEFTGDLGGGGGGFPGPFPGRGETLQIPPEWCQVSDCDNSRLVEVSQVLQETARGPGFKEALDPYVSWEHHHQFQCLSWILWTGDDAIHASHNILLIERDTDRKLVWAPYSVDISQGLPGWSESLSLTGSDSIADGCQRDPECWQDVIASCEDLIMRFDELNPEEVLDEMVTTLTDLDMMRYGDDERAEQLREWLVWRQTVLLDELESFRYLPDEFGNCPDGMIQCGDGGCGTPEACETRECPRGQQICEASGSCMWPPDCPTCSETSPFYCEVTNQCVAEQQICEDACAQQEEAVWCEATNRCTFIFECPIEDDAGVIIGFAGVGGMGGVGGRPGGGVAGAGAVEPLPAHD